MIHYMLVNNPGHPEMRSQRSMRGRNHVFANPYWPKPSPLEEKLIGLVKDSILRGCLAVRKIALPAIIVQGLILATVLSYFFIPQSILFFDGLLKLRDSIGPTFPFISMGLIAVFAETLARMFSRNWHGYGNSALFGFIIFGVLGVTTDAFYLLQNNLWAGLPNHEQIIAKVLFDQFVYTVFFANPYQTFLYVYRDCDYSPSRFKRRITPFSRFYTKEVLAVLITNWAFWIPMTAILYSLPLDIQFVVSRMAIVIWVLLLTSLTLRNAEK